MRFLLSLFLTLFIWLQPAYSATAEQWRGRSIYQLLTDRYALPAGSDPGTLCNAGEAGFCGGTWNSIRENLDYIRNMGFTAIWISPVHKNYDGPRTPYGFAYHGYWISDISQLNSHFGTSDDLKALSKAVHDKGMFLMVDIVVNHVASTTISVTDYSPYFFKSPAHYHRYCPLDASNQTSMEQCWLGDDKVALVDVNTEHPDVVASYNRWIGPFIKEYGIDGIRLDAARHVRRSFWPGFCASAGVFCMGEVFEGDPVVASTYQGGVMDSILNFPLYFALRDAFSIPGPQNIPKLASLLETNKDRFKDVGLLGNFVENHDVPRWAHGSVDPQSLYNSMTFSFMSSGIPIVYAGQEQGYAGGNDPENREALWLSRYSNTTACQMITTLNKACFFTVGPHLFTFKQFREFLIKTTDWLSQPTSVLASNAHEIAIIRGNVISILTNIGSPPANESIAVFTPFQRNVAITDIFSCVQYQVGSNGSINIQYSQGGRPVVLMPNSLLRGSGLCGIQDGPRSLQRSDVVRTFSNPNSLSLLLSLLVIMHVS